METLSKERSYLVKLHLCSAREGNVFTGMCQSVHEGSLSHRRAGRRGCPPSGQKDQLEQSPFPRKDQPERTGQDGRTYSQI